MSGQASDAVDLGAPLSPVALTQPHSASGAAVETSEAAATPPAAAVRRWVPRRVVITPAAAEHPHAARILDRVHARGVEVERLRSNRLTGLRGENDRQTYTRAKSTLAIVVSPPSRRKLAPIAPSADWRVDFAEGCPAHCQYCYLAGSLTGPPVTRVYADLDDILANLAVYAGSGSVTSRSARRAGEGTTFEASCYSDPLALEHLTGSWQRAVEYFGIWQAPVQLRWTTKFGDVAPFVGLEHRGRTRVRFSVNALPVTTRWEGGTDPLARRLDGLRTLALDGYPVGLTIAPIMAIDGWQEHYRDLVELVRQAVDGVAGLDLTAELITHRFSAGSRDVLRGWYPRTTLEMDADARAVKRGKFGSTKYVYPPAVMAELRRWFTAEIAERLPQCRILYWT